MAVIQTGNCTIVPSLSSQQTADVKTEQSESILYRKYYRNEVKNISSGFETFCSWVPFILLIIWKNRILGNLICRLERRFWLIWWEPKLRQTFCRRVWGHIRTERHSYSIITSYLRVSRAFRLLVNTPCYWLDIKWFILANSKVFYYRSIGPMARDVVWVSPPPRIFLTWIISPKISILSQFRSFSVENLSKYIQAK